MIMHWQQWYYVVIFASSLAIGLLKKEAVERVVQLAFTIFGGYVLYSAGFFNGMVP